jgi:hypothetical protein
VEKVLGRTAGIVRHPPKLAPEEVMRRWVRETSEAFVYVAPSRSMVGRLARS